MISACHKCLVRGHGGLSCSPLVRILFGSLNKTGLFPNIQTPLTNVNAHVWTHEKQTRKKRGVTLLAALRASNIDHQSPDIDYIYRVDLFYKMWKFTRKNDLPCILQLFKTGN